MLRTTLDITAISKMDMCLAAIITLPSRRLFSFGITGKSLSSQVGNITRYLMPAKIRATVNTPYAHLKTKKLHNFLFINPTNSIGDHRIKCTANAVLPEAVGPAIQMMLFIGLVPPFCVGGERGQE